MGHLFTCCCGESGNPIWKLVPCDSSPEPFPAEHFGFENTWARLVGNSNDCSDRKLLFHYPQEGCPYYEIQNVENSTNALLEFSVNLDLPTPWVRGWCGTLEFVGYQCPRENSDFDCDDLPEDQECICTNEIECDEESTPEDWAIYVIGDPPADFDDLGYRQTESSSDRNGIWIERGFETVAGVWPSPVRPRISASIYTASIDFGTGDCIDRRDCCDELCTYVRPWTEDQLRAYWRNNVVLSMDFSGITSCNYSTNARLTGCASKSRSVQIAASGFQQDGVVGNLVTFSYLVAMSVGPDPSCEGCDPSAYSETEFPGGSWTYTACGNLEVNGFSSSELVIDAGATNLFPLNDNPQCDNQTPDRNWCFLPGLDLYIHGVHGRFGTGLEQSEAALFWNQTVSYTFSADFIGDTFGLVPADGDGEPAGSVVVNITAPAMPSDCGEEPL